MVMECEGKRYKIGTGIGAGAFGVVKLAADVAGGPAEGGALGGGVPRGRGAFLLLCESPP